MNTIVILLASLIVCAAYTLGRISMRMEIDKEEHNASKRSTR